MGKGDRATFWAIYYSSGLNAHLIFSRNAKAKKSYFPLNDH